ncbi:MAG: hypothetical protein IIV04_06135, partial [Bacteroidaceae bacterium]|nr:hypothetical protein [Bacteroidaceae bacterium]
MKQGVSRFFLRFFVPAVVLLLLFAVAFMYYHYEVGQHMESKLGGTAGVVAIMAFAATIIVAVLWLLYRLMKYAGSSDFATQKLLQHLSIAQEGIAVFDSKHRVVFANPLFSEYADFISPSHLENAGEILKLPQLRKIERFIDNGGYRNNSVREDYALDNIEVSGRVFALRCVLFSDNGFEISINDITAAEEQSRLKRQLTQNVAHEFKTPVCS